MARNTEGGARLRQHFRDSIRDALTGVDVDELQGRTTLRVPSDVSLLTREAVTDLEVELSRLRAERAELAKKAAGGAVVEPPPPAPRKAWRRGRNGNGAAVAEVSAVSWSVARAMEPVAEVASPPARDGALEPVADVVPAPEGLTAEEVVAEEVVAEGVVAEDVAAEPVTVAEPSAPVAAPRERPTGLSAPKSKPPAPTPRRRRPSTQLSDAELESVVAPLLTELANLRAEVRELRGGPEAAAPTQLPSNKQLVRLVAGLLLGFALIAVALVVVLKA